MAARRRVTSKLQVQYRKAAKADKGEILIGGGHHGGGSFDGSACAIRPAPVGSGRPDRRPQVAAPAFQRRRQGALEHVRALMGMPCGKYLTVMLEAWLPLLAVQVI